jgi:hypothetical protein
MLGELQDAYHHGDHDGTAADPGNAPEDPREKPDEQAHEHGFRSADKINPDHKVIRET